MRYLRWPKYRLPFSVWENRQDLGERGGTEPQPTAAAVSCRSARSLRCLCSTSIARTTDQSVLTDGLRLAGSRQRFRPREAKLHRAISESADKPQTLLRDIGITDGRSILCPLSQERTQFPESRVGSHVRRCANVTTDTAFAFHSGTSGSEGLRAIADMFCWLTARVALLWEMTHLCRNPQTVGRGSTDGSARVSSMALPAAPCCPWDDFPMQRYEAAVGWPRYSLPTG